MSSVIAKSQVKCPKEHAESIGMGETHSTVGKAGQQVLSSPYAEHSAGLRVYTPSPAPSIHLTLLTTAREII